MRTERFSAAALVALFHRKTIATMTQLKEALGTRADITVFRKLRQLSYRTSYSHRGQYYTLDELMDLDELGLWSHRSVWFSQHGSLLATAETLVVDSATGYFADELETVLHVSVKEALLKLERRGRLGRKQVSGRFLYGSPEAAVRKQQLLARRLEEQGPSATPGVVSREGPLDEVKAALLLFVSLLDERQRRLYAGFEALQYGHGGDRRMAILLDMDVATVARGRRELLARDFDVARVRKTGAGRPTAEKKRLK